MVRAYDMDLRKRVLAFVAEGGSLRAAAKQFSIGISTVGSWSRQWRQSGRMTPHKQGRPNGSVLDNYRDFILGMIEQNKDITLVEMSETLETELGVRVASSTFWYWLDREGITFKKRQRTPPNKIERTCI